MLQELGTNSAALHDLELLQKAVRDKATKDFSQGAIHIDLVNRLCLRFLGAGISAPDCADWLEHNYPKAVEACFSELHAHSFNYARKLLDNPDTAEDIAQECIRELLGSQNEINNLKAWLARVAHNKAVALFQGQSRNDKLLNDLSHIQETPHDPDEEKLWEKFTPEKVKKLLSKTDFQLYKKLAAARNLKEYATREKISYQTAKEHRHRLKVNLRSAYLKEQGWRDSPVILDYQQLRSIRRFIAKITGTCSGKLSSRYQQLAELFAGGTGIMTWEISMLDNNAFNVIVMVSTKDIPVTVFMDIKMNRANRITILNYKKATLIATIPSGDSHVMSSEKGKGKLDYKQLLSIAHNATVYDQKLFDEMLEKYKKR